MIMKTKGKFKIRFLSALFIFIMVVAVIPVPCRAKPKTSGMKVEYRSVKNIRKFVKKHKFSTTKKLAYSKKPSLKKSSYREGKLKKSSLNNGLNALNTMRYIAGISANVKLDNTYNQKCQTAALINAANKKLSNHPVRPSKMSEVLYQTGLEGAVSSNIARTSWPTNLAYGVVYQWMEDSDPCNISRVSHRRWILNPSVKKTGFGSVNNYSAMYAFDNFAGSTDYYGVAWPAQNMPIQYFSDSTAWSISMGKEVDISKTKVTLTRKKDKKKWVFSQKKSNGYFNVENSKYGQTGCIIFRPKNISYKAGDIFQVKITGLDQTVSYEVKFFNL